MFVCSYRRRYQDQIFFTWNRSEGELCSALQKFRTQYPNLHCQTLTGSIVQYLNAYIENRQGQLYSRVIHNPTIQAYTLPYVVGHPKLKHSDWLRAALIRAVCYCSSVDDFHQERIYIELTYLVNGYSLLFVECHMQHFFKYFETEDMRYSLDQAMYDKFRRQWFEWIDWQRELNNKLETVDNNGNLIRLNYLYEYGPRCQFKEDFHVIWSKYLNTDPQLSEKTSTILLTTKHVHSLNALLSQQKSSYWIQQ